MQDAGIGVRVQPLTSAHHRVGQGCGGGSLHALVHMNMCSLLGVPAGLVCRYEGGDKVTQVMREVDQVKGQMADNINQAMSNLEATEQLNEKTQEMKAQSNMFNKQAKTAKNQMWWKNMKLNIIIAAVVIIIVGGFVVSYWPS